MSNASDRERLLSLLKPEERTALESVGTGKWVNSVNEDPSLSWAWFHFPGGEYTVLVKRGLLRVTHRAGGWAFVEPV